MRFPRNLGANNTLVILVEYAPFAVYSLPERRFRIRRDRRTTETLVIHANGGTVIAYCLDVYNRYNYAEDVPTRISQRKMNELLASGSQ